MFYVHFIKVMLLVSIEIFFIFQEEKPLNEVLSSPVHEWTSEQVALWLQTLGFDHHVPQFLDSDITGQILLQIDSSRLKVCFISHAKICAISFC